MHVVLLRWVSKQGPMPKEQYCLTDSVWVLTKPAGLLLQVDQIHLLSVVTIVDDRGVSRMQLHGVEGGVFQSYAAEGCG